MISVKKIYCVILLSFFCVSGFSAQKELCRFTLNSFEGWNYNRTGEKFELNTSNIGKLNIVLFNNYVLTSPEFDCGECDSIEVNVCYAPKKTDYVVSKLPLTVTLYSDANIVGEVTQTVKAGLVEQDVVCKLPVRNKVHSIVLSAKKADIDNNAAVRSVIITGFIKNNFLPEDVNQDGGVDITDVNIVVNKIMGGDTSFNTDINGDGLTDISDINAVVSRVMNQ